MRAFHLGLSWATGAAGGSGRVIEMLGEHLPGCSVQIKGAVTGPVDVEELTAGQFKLLANPSLDWFQRLRCARSVTLKEINDWQPDILAIHFSLSALPIIDRFRHHAVVMHFHGPWAAESIIQGSGLVSARLRKQIETTVYQRADRVIVLSEAFASLAAEHYGVSPEIIRVIPGAVDILRFSRGRRVGDEIAYGYTQPDRPFIVTARRLVPRMGLENLVRAIQLVKNVRPDILLCIAGKGPLFETLGALVAELRLDDNVRLLGFVSDERLIDLFAGATLSVVPSVALEGFGLVAIESLAAGTPVLVTPIGGLPEAVRDLSSRLVFRSGSPDDMAQGIIDALSDLTALPDGAACRSYVESRFTAQIMAERVAEVYREVV